MNTLDKNNYENGGCSRQDDYFVLNVYFQLGKMVVVKISPETVWNGLIKIGGILGILGLVVSIARLINEKNLNTKID